MMFPRIEPLWLRHDFHVLTEVVFWAALVANIMPATVIFRRWRWALAVYCWLVDFVAFLALNWRTRLPSNDLEFLGFRRPAMRWIRKHTPHRHRHQG
jgi:hypothetical protein